MASPIEQADIVRRIVEDLSSADQKITGSTLKLFTTLNGNEKAAVQAAARERLAGLTGAQSAERLRITQEGQLRRDRLKNEAELSKLQRKAETDVSRKGAPTAFQIRSDQERSRKIRLADARKNIRLSKARRIAPQDALRSIRVLAEVDPDAARSLQSAFLRDPTGEAGKVRPQRAGIGIGSGGARIRSFRERPGGRGTFGVQPGRELAISSPALRLEPSPRAIGKAGKQIGRKKLLKGGLLGGAALIGLPMLFKALSGGEKSGGQDIPLDIQMQLLQSLGGGGGRQIDPDLQTGRQLRNVFQLLQIIKTLRDMQQLGQQPTVGGLV